MPRIVAGMSVRTNHIPNSTNKIAMATNIEEAPIKQRATCGRISNCEMPMINRMIPTANSVNVTINIANASAQAVITSENKTATNVTMIGNHTGNSTTSKIINIA